MLAAAGVSADTPATVLCDGDAGLWWLQRETLPAATVALDWWHIAIRFEHALQTARGLGAGSADADLADEAVRNLERAKWRLWHGRWTGCRRKLAVLCINCHYPSLYCVSQPVTITFYSRSSKGSHGAVAGHRRIKQQAGRTGRNSAST